MSNVNWTVKINFKNISMKKDLKTEIKWDIPERRKPNRGKNWYIISFSFIFLIIFFSFFSLSIRPLGISFLSSKSNFLLPIIIILSVGIMVFDKSENGKMIRVKISQNGITVGGIFYDYDIIKNFCVIYKPKEGIKQLYVEFKSPLKPMLSIPLRSLNALEIRNFLARHLEEDLERISPPLSEQLTKLLKL